MSTLTSLSSLAVFLAFFTLSWTITLGEKERNCTERLQDAIHRADPAINVFLNHQRVQLYQAQVEAEKDPVQRAVQRAYLPIELLRAGMIMETLNETLDLQRLAIEWKTPKDAPVMRNFREVIALSYLRLGEQDNGVTNRSSESSLIPIRSSGIHKNNQRGSRLAIREYTSLLEDYPESLTCRWLLNLAYMTLGEYPDKVPSQWLVPPKAFASDYEMQRFPDIAPAVGLAYVGLAGGSIVEDFDHDGFQDVMVSSYSIKGPLQYFHSNGDGTFANHTERAGLQGQLGGLNTIAGDYNNDGFVDVMVLRGGWFSILGQGQGNFPNSLLRNNGDGTFTDVTVEAGVFAEHPTHSAVFFDYDLDGSLDLFVANESVGQEVHPCHLFHNQGDGTFKDVAPALRLDHKGFIKAVVAGDYDNDGDPDLYLSQFQQENLLFRNDGADGRGWKFTEVGKKAGVQEPSSSFTSWFWDYDNDGWEDLFVSSFAGYYHSSLEEVVADYLGKKPTEYSRLYRNDRDGTFTDVTTEAGLDDALLTMGANFGDLDNDGFLDCYIGTGQPAMQALVPNRMYRNDRGRTFQDVTSSGGFGHIQKGHGISFADMDNDGDQDIHTVIGGGYSGDVYQNSLFENPGSSNHWITLRLVGVSSNRTAIGARIKVTTKTEDGTQNIYVTVSTGGSFGISSVQQEIGLGAASAIEAIEIRWPNRERTQQRFENVSMDQVIEIREGTDELRQVPARQFRFRRAPQVIAE